MSCISTAHVRGGLQGRKEMKRINVLHESNPLDVVWTLPHHIRPGGRGHTTSGPETGHPAEGWQR